jgi:transporter family-2 protein
LLAVAAGAAIAVQSSFSGAIGRRLGVLETSFVVHLVGLALASVLMIALRGGHLGGWRSVPWYAYSAGFIGVGIVAAVSFAVPRLGLATSLTLTIVAQLFLGAVLDHFGCFGAELHPLTTARALGLGVLLVGTWLVVR